MSTLTDPDGALRRFAVVVITEAPSAEEAKRLLELRLAEKARIIWLADAAPVGPAKKYELAELRLFEDGEGVVTGPSP